MKDAQAEKRWVLCPRCGAKTRVQLLRETELRLLLHDGEASA